MKKIIVTLLILSLTSFAYAEKIRVWHKADGTLRHTVCGKGVDYDKCMTDTLGAIPELADYEYQDIERADMPTDDGRAWEWDKTTKRVKVNQQKLQQIKKDDADKVLIEKERQKILEDQAVANLRARGAI